MIKQFYFKQFSLELKKQFKSQKVLFDPYIGPYQMLP